jgi:CheY-like chemotaxis protein
MREPPRVLVVDDNPANLEIIETRLARQGYEIVTARDGDEALIAAREQTPDLILLDVMMPGKDGIQVCRELKADPDLPFMPIILVTAKAIPTTSWPGSMPAATNTSPSRSTTRRWWRGFARSCASRHCTIPCRSRRRSSRPGTASSRSV